MQAVSIASTHNLRRSSIVSVNFDGDINSPGGKSTSTISSFLFTPEAADTLRENNPALAEARVSVSPVRTIMREYRLFFVDGRLVTGSLYRQAGEVVLSGEVDPDAVAYGEAIAQQWSPAEAFVMDIALTDDGYRVIEFNNINSSGFYAADVERYIDAIERAFDGSNRSDH